MQMVRIKMQKTVDGKPVSGNVKVVEITKETYEMIKTVSGRKITVLKEFEIEI